VTSDRLRNPALRAFPQKVAADPRSGSTLSGGISWLFAVAGFAVGGRIISDNSLLTHLATGNLIVEQGRVPAADPYSHDFVGMAWTVQSWLASLVYSQAVSLGGEPMLRLIHGLLAALVMAGVWRLTAPARQLVTRVGLALLPLLVGGSLWSPRPFMFGLVGMVVVLLVMRGLVRPWALLPAMYLWVNSHGSFPLALVLIGAAAVGQVIDERRPPITSLRIGGWMVAGMMFAGFNPVGPRLWWFPVMLLSRGEALEEVVEWAPPSFDKPVDYVYLGLLPLLVVAAKRGMPWADLLPALGFFATGLLAIRNMATASLVIVAMVAPTLTELVGRTVGDERGRPARMVTVAGVTGLAVSVFVAATSPGLVLDRYPVDAFDYLEARALAPSDDVIVVHREGVGNYLTYRYGAEAGVFIDDRFDFYPVDRTKDHLTLVYGGDYRDVLDRHHADVVVWERDSELTDWLDEEPGWDLAYRDDEWVVACRTSGPAADRCKRSR